MPLPHSYPLFTVKCRSYHQGMRIRKGDVAVAIVYIAFIIASILSLEQGGNILTVETENGSYAYSLSENGIYDFSGPLGTTEIEIRDGKARVISSPCRNGICMEAGWSDTLCCLPNRIIATSTGNEGGLDAISG